jgi:hypothetical protein
MTKPKPPGSPRLKTGAPTTYNKSYCATVVQFGKIGKGPAAVSAHIGVHKDTLYEWGRVHPEFSVALKKQKSLIEAWLLAQANRMIKGGKGNDRLIIFMLNAQHGYKESSSMDVTTKTEVEFTFASVQDDPSTTAV